MIRIMLSFTKSQTIEMKVISILQPWASLVALGHKRIETRSWNTKYRGELLIHASKRMLDMFEQKEFWERLYGEVNFDTYKELASMPRFEELPYGSIIGKVNLIDTCTTEEAKTRLYYKEYSQNHSREQELAFGDYSPTRFGWLLSDPILFKEPIPCKGQLGIWNLPAELESLIINQNK